MFHLLSDRVWAGSVLAILVITRWPIAPKYLYYFDSVNFALALEEFNPALHQPQPPGYPLFVAFTKLIHTIVPGAREVFLIAGILAAWLAILLCRKIGSEMFSGKAGSAAAILLMFNPVLWLGGITNQVRVFLAAGSTAVLLAAWRAHDRQSDVRWFYLAAAVLGIASGFRPAMLPFLLPVLVLTGIRSRRVLHEWLITGVIGAVSVAVWLVPTVIISGGIERYAGLLNSYAGDQFRGSSLLYGAGQDSAWRMAKAAMIWNGLGVVTWIWTIHLRSDWRPGIRAAFLLAAFLPAFLFHTFVHVGDPDHTLVTVPMLCLVGGAFLARRHPNYAILAAVLNIVLFVRPPAGLARASGYPAVAYVDRVTREAFDAIDRVRATGPVVLISQNSQITWRHLSFYFPSTPLIVLHQDPSGTPDLNSAWLMLNRHSVSVTVRDGAIQLPAKARRVWVLPAPAEGMQATASPFVFTDTHPGSAFRLGAYRFQSTGSPQMALRLQELLD
jgi:hypothetical protein